MILIRCIGVYSAFFFPFLSSSPIANHNVQNSKNAAETDSVEA